MSSEDKYIELIKSRYVCVKEDIDLRIVYTTLSHPDYDEILIDMELLPQIINDTRENIGQFIDDNHIAVIVADGIGDEEEYYMYYDGLLKVLHHYYDEEEVKIILNVLDLRKNGHTIIDQYRKGKSTAEELGITDVKEVRIMNNDGNFHNTFYYEHKSEDKDS